MEVKDFVVPIEAWLVFLLVCLAVSLTLSQSLRLFVGSYDNGSDP